jgi:hypothetical protein
MQGRAFGAESPKVCGMIGVAFYINYAMIFCFNDDPATHATVTTGGLGL